MSVLYFLGYRSFKSEIEIKQIVLDFIRVSHSNLSNTQHVEENLQVANSSNLNLLDIHTLKILQTSKQQTWIVLAENYLYCLLDDISVDIQRSSTELIKWRAKVGDIKNHITVRPSTKNSEKYGLIDFGTKHKNWYFSKSLLNDEEMAESHINNLVGAT
ncbi:MAG: hypothetical protein ACT4ON_11070 [Bacteroidota bacterium]